jgi:TatD DNase family protein
MIDTHAHIYDVKFAEDRNEAVQRSVDAGISKILMPNCAAETIDAMLDCEKKYPGICIPMMGLHPCYVSDFTVAQELKIVQDWLAKRSFCAVGEIGLDYYWDKTFIAEQQQAFRTQIELALHYNLPIVVHSRESNDDCIAIVQEYTSKGLRGVFHCFSGTMQQANQLVDIGFYLGIGGVLTYKKSGLSEIISTINPKHLLLETDAPYLAPSPHRGKRNETSFMVHIAQHLADIQQTSLAEIDRITTQNANQLFGL